MTKADRELLLLLIVRPSMYVHPVEASTITSFITGYEVRNGSKSRFTKLVSDLISNKYKISYSSDGWPGQIRLLARRYHSTWPIIFKKITLEVIVNAEGGSLTDKQQEAVKRKITTGIIDQAVPTGGPCFENWVEEWPALCDVKSSWFKQLWSRQEWAIIKAIDKLVQTNGIFEVGDQRQPSEMLLQLRERYAEAIGISPSSLKVC